MSSDQPSPAAAVPGLRRSDPHGPGTTREHSEAGFRYRDPSGAVIRTWNATVLMGLLLANAAPSPAAHGRKRVIAASVRGVADWLGDTPAVARSSYIDPRLISRYESEGQLPTIPPHPPVLPTAAEAETAVAALLAAGD